jgi:hypothetical protein
MLTNDNEKFLSELKKYADAMKVELDSKLKPLEKKLMEINEINNLCISEDKNSIYVVQKNLLKEIRIEDSIELQKLILPSDLAIRISLSPDYRNIAIGFSDGKILIADITNFVIIKELDSKLSDEAIDLIEKIKNLKKELTPTVGNLINSKIRKDMLDLF